MIKTEIDNQGIEDRDEDIVVKEVAMPKTSYLYGVVVLVLIFVGFLAVFLITRGGVSQLPSNPAKYSNVSALPLGSPTNSAVQPSQSSKSNYKQSATDSASLGAAYTGLQNVPQGKNTPTTSGIQSTGQSAPTGQSINPSLPY